LFVNDPGFDHNGDPIDPGFGTLIICGWLSAPDGTDAVTASVEGITNVDA